VSVVVANGRLHHAFLELVKDLPRRRDLGVLEGDGG
jgi:hypothetical protein